MPHDLPVGTLLNRLAVQGSEVIPITKEERLVGILTRSDIIRLLLSGAEERPAAQPGKRCAYRRGPAGTPVNLRAFVQRGRSLRWR